MTRNQDSKLFDLSRTHQKTCPWRFYLTKRTKKIFWICPTKPANPTKIVCWKNQTCGRRPIKKKTSSSYLLLSSWQKKLCTCSATCSRRFLLLAQNGWEFSFFHQNCSLFFPLASNRAILVVLQVFLVKKSFFHPSRQWYNIPFSPNRIFRSAVISTV